MMRVPRHFTKPIAHLRHHCIRPTDSKTSSSTPLLLHLHRQIQFHGPLTVADYMRACLLHPTYGYYTTSPHIFNSPGDFITSPQLTPIFSQLISVFLAHSLQNNPYHLIELGPGTGSLLAAAIPALRKLSALPNCLTLVERSRRLRQCQLSALAESGLYVNWVDTLDEALETGNSPRVFLMHEFLDALPVHVFQRDGDRWRERLVDVNGEHALRFVLAGGSTQALALLDVFEPQGDITEVGAEAVSVVERVAETVRKDGGMGLLIDYGEDGQVGDSVRAFEKHLQVDVLERPGECDVTADINFAQIRMGVEQTEGVVMRGPVSQREFLLRLGAADRFRVVAKGVIDRAVKDGETDEVVDKKLDRLQADYDRLVGESQMGLRYKVAAIVRAENAELAGGL